MPKLTAKQLAERITPHFTWNEMLDQVDQSIPVAAQQQIRRLCGQMEVLRKACGNRPIIVNSGFRTPEHNRAVGGASQSFHMTGQAADIHIEGMTPAELAEKAKPLFLGVITYPAHVHVDTRSVKYHDIGVYK